jgi:hypothetical protein
LQNVLAGLQADNLATAVELANLPEQVRRFGHVKEAAVVKFRAEKARWLGLNTVKQAAWGSDPGSSLEGLTPVELTGSAPYLTLT